MADATDLKSVEPQGSCGFKSHPRHVVFFIIMGLEADPKRCLVADEVRAAGFGGANGSSRMRRSPTPGMLFL